jgi:hypothetical protein
LREYYACSVRIRGEDIHVLWFTNDMDGLERTDSGSIRHFDDLDQVRAYCVANEIDLSTPATKYDLDQILLWSRSPIEPLNCPEVLNTWNFLMDAQQASDSNELLQHADRRAGGIYDKLFFGSNLPSVTPEGQEYQPAWSVDELQTLSSLLTRGIHAFVQNINSSEHGIGS